ncbi:MAG TPA: TetR/AcrR family transcriptional regulator [Gammaproteobacteria bacterium]|nr:TetR/AcrR family transcriptional regulator [Gammaproteobacteria bacterium]
MKHSFETVPIMDSSTRNTALSTRDRILLTAERLFAETGIAATSLRTITAAAGVNLAAVNYHFGSKDALVEAVYRRHLEPLNRARLANLERLEEEANGKPLDVETLVRAFVEPLIEQAGTGDSGRVLTRLLAQSLHEAAGYVERFYARENDAVLQRYRDAMQRAIPELSPDEICWRLNFMLGTLHNAFLDAGLLKLISEENAPGPETTLAQLIPFLVAGLTAPGERAAAAL